ncbi:MAG: response regulator [Spirochaetes bacterium]|nr:response regulator [Spirochaetota bacterium]
MGKQKVLIVEDEVINALVLKRLIEYGWDVQCENVRTGEEFIEKALKSNYNLFIVDIMLAGKIDGIDAVKIIQKERSDAHVIYITASTDENTYTRDLTTKLIQYIKKPFNDQELINAVKRVL